MTACLRGSLQSFGEPLGSSANSLRDSSSSASPAGSPRGASTSRSPSSRWQRRSESNLADLEPARGGEVNKTRPVVVVSRDVLNAALETVVVCPLTTQLHPRWRSRVQVTSAGKKAEIAVDQIRTISQSRLRKQIDQLSPSRAAELRAVIAETYAEP